MGKKVSFVIVPYKEIKDSVSVELEELLNITGIDAGAFLTMFFDSIQSQRDFRILDNNNYLIPARELVCNAYLKQGLQNAEVDLLIYMVQELFEFHHVKLERIMLNKSINDRWRFIKLINDDILVGR